jgi:hypothetical protein
MTGRNNKKGQQISLLSLDACGPGDRHIRVAPRSESIILMIAGGDHTIM